jgi:protein O-GlcNAc transferase
MEFTYRKKAFDIEGLSPDEHIIRIITRTSSFYERDLLEYMYLMTKHCNKSNTVAIDVGANIGNHSIFMRSFLANHLIAIEPNTKILPILHRNLAHNIDNFSISECALGESAGTGKIIMPMESTGNIGMAKVVMDGNDGTLEITTLDSIVEKWEKEQNVPAQVSIIKIDVEGMELAVLKGAEKTIRNNKPHIFVEAESAQELSELNNYLQPFGYKKLSRLSKTPVYHFAFNPNISLIYKAHLTAFLSRKKAMFFQIMGGIKIRFNKHNK